LNSVGHYNHQDSHCQKRRLFRTNFEPDRALARAIEIFQGAMDRNRDLNAQVLRDSEARDRRASQIEESVAARSFISI